MNDAATDGAEPAAQRAKRAGNFSLLHSSYFAQTYPEEWPVTGPLSIHTITAAARDNAG